MRRALALLLAAAPLALPRPADACSKRHEPPFELAAVAARVAVVRVLEAPGPREAGPVRLRVQRGLKGARRGHVLVARETNTSCRTGFRTGRRALVFLRRDGWAAGHYEGYLELAHHPGLVVDAVARWLAATDDAGRLAVLLDAIEQGDDRLAREAAFTLADRPDLLPLVEAAGRDRLLAALRDRPEIDRLPFVLTRLREARAIPVLEPRSRGMGHRDRMAGLALILLRLPSLEDVDDPARLADLVERAPSAVERALAFERCERVRGRSLHPSASWSHGIGDEAAPRLAARCRDGGGP